jgi:hypothetical protein
MLFTQSASISTGFVRETHKVRRSGQKRHYFGWLASQPEG